MALNAVIVGAGPGVSSAFARAVLDRGGSVHLASRDPSKLQPVAQQLGGKTQTHQCDASDAASVEALFAKVPGRIDVVLYNPSRLVRGPVAEINPEDARKAVELTGFGSFLTAQQAAKRMLAQEPVNGCRGTILFTGASAGVKGFPNSCVFAMGKFAQRGLSQSLSRELHPKGIHVAWVNIDGPILAPGAEQTPEVSRMNPADIAKNYLHLVDQDRSCWSQELDIRTWVEKF